MQSLLKKIVSYILIFTVLMFTTIALLGVWEIIDLQNVMKKLLASLLIVFTASAVILFIFSVLVKESGNQNQQEN